MNDLFKQSVWIGVKRSIPLVIGFVPVGFVLGIQASEKSMPLWQIGMMTGLNFAGGSEFVAVGLWSAVLNSLLIIAITFFINSRHILMGMCLSPYVSHRTRTQKFIGAFFMCDESWALGYSEGKGGHRSISFTTYITSALLLYSTWSGSTMIGWIFAPYLKGIGSHSLMLIFPIVFFVLLKGIWRSHTDSLCWLIALIAAITTYLVVPGPTYLMVGTGAGVLAGIIQKKLHKSNETIHGSC